MFSQTLGNPVRQTHKTVFSQNLFPKLFLFVREYSSKIRKAAFTLEQVIFSVESKKNLFPKLFLFVKEYSSKIRKAALTLEQVNFSQKSKKNLFPKLFLFVT